MYFWEKIGGFGNNTALITSEREITYKQLQDEITDITSLYEVRGLAFLMCSNSIESVTLYLSLLSARIPTVLINEHIEDSLLENLITTYKPYYIWHIGDLGTSHSEKKYGGYRLYIDRNSSCEIHDELALLLTTSGSTGSPKLVRQSRKNIESNTASIIEYLGITEKDRAITTLPMHYTFGLSIINTHIAAGASILLTNVTPLQPPFWKMLTDYNITTFSGVPYTFEMLKRIHFFRKDLSTLRYITQAGGKLGKELHTEFAEGCMNKGIDFVVMYGQTEATARMSYLPAPKALEKAGSIGIAIPHGEFWIEDPEGNKIEDTDVPGELVYRGDNVTMGYAEGKDDLRLGYTNGDVLHTGDIAIVDKEGFYYIVGRLKRFLKIYGNRVNLDEVESKLKVAGIDNVACGKDDNLRICVLNEDDKSRAEELILTRTNIPRFGFKVCVIDEVPRNSSGKIQYSELEKMICCQ